MLLYAGGSPQGRRPPSPVCQQAKFLLSDSGESDSPAGKCFTIMGDVVAHSGFSNAEFREHNGA